MPGLPFTLDTRRRRRRSGIYEGAGEGSRGIRQIICFLRRRRVAAHQTLLAGLLLLSSSADPNAKALPAEDMVQYVWRGFISFPS